MRGGRTDLIYGESGVGKTSNIGWYAKYIYESTAMKYGEGLRTRLITLDGGGWEPIQQFIDAGIIEVLPLSGAQHIISKMDALAKGYWPDLSEVVVDANLSMDKLPPVKNWQRPDNLNFRAIGVGAYAIEGLTSYSNALMAALTREGPTLGEKASYTYQEKTDSGGVAADGAKYYGANRAYYGFIQNRVLDILPKFGALPVERVLWTALETEGTDDGETIIGPKTAGKAITADIPQFVGQCLHFESYIKEKVKPKEVDVQVATIKQRIMGMRMYFRSHPDPKTGRVHKCKPRVAPNVIPKLMEKYPDGFVELRTDGGIDEYLHYLDSIHAEGMTGLSTWKDEIDQKAKEKREVNN